jgi:hypothetical protein
MNFHLGETVEARHLVITYHYSRRWPAGVQLVGTDHQPGGLFGDSGPATAACVYGQPAARWSQPVIELTRLVRTPTHTNPLSALVAETTRWIRRKNIADLVVSFADATVDHHGGIYQACSWNYHGQRPGRMDGVTVNGVFIPGRNANHEWGTQSPTRLAEIGIHAEPHYDHGKHLYWRALTRTGHRQAEALKLQTNPYPKPAQQAAA